MKKRTTSAKAKSVISRTRTLGSAASTAVLEDELLPDPTEIAAVPTSVLNRESTNVTAMNVDDSLKTVFIPTDLHAHFECVVGKHVFIDKPWTHVSRQKIIDHLNSEKSNSCFWHVQKELEAIQHDTVLIAYKPLTDANEEFIICVTDKAREYVEEKQTLYDRELEQRVDQLMERTPGVWESGNSEREINDIKPVPTREKVGGSLVSKETQTTPKIKDNKCIQSVAEEEEMFQLRNLTKPDDKALNDFLEKHVPNLVETLRANELYDLYRDDYKSLKNDKKTSTKFEIITRGRTSNVAVGSQCVSSQRWHPTIAGVFALSYMTNSNVLDNTTEDEASEIVTTTSRSHKDTKIGVANNKNCCQPPPSNHYADFEDNIITEKLMSLLNKEFVQKMRTLEVAEEEKTDEHYLPGQSHNNSFVYPDVLDDETTNDESEINSKTQVKQVNEDDVICPRKKTTTGYQDKHEADHHDSDTDSFYNVWGSDDEWPYQMRNAVRNIHRNFNKKYTLHERQKKLLELLLSETQYTSRKKKLDAKEMEKKDLTEAMFDTRDDYRKLLKTKHENDSGGCLSTSAKLATDTDDRHMPKQDPKMSPTNNQYNNSVFIYSDGGETSSMNPKLILESPEDVYCIEFNPRHGNTIVGGLTNGQICIWDIEEKLKQICSRDIAVTEKEKLQTENIWRHVETSSDIIPSQIKPTALSNVVESHDSTVTAIQWINPMTEITPSGQLVTVTEKFSDQFLSASTDGTVKFWDLQSTPMPNPTNSKKTRYQRPEKVKKHVSPLSIYNHRLKPTYTITITDPESSVNCPITALSFDTPAMQYQCKTQPRENGKQHFEYVPVTPTEDPNRVLVIGHIFGRVGVVTWNGYNSGDKDQKHEEECTHIWWGQVHDGPISSIKRNNFYPDIHLACGGNVVSIWSLKYQGGPIWWKRFDEPLNGLLWSNLHPAEFRVLCSTGQLQCWNLTKFTHLPSDCCDLPDFKAKRTGILSAPYPTVHYVGAERLALFERNPKPIPDYRRNESICYLSSSRDVVMITVNMSALGQDTIDEVGVWFQKEIDWRNEIDADNENYKKEFGTTGENDIDITHYRSTIRNASTSSKVDDDQPALTSKQIKRQISDETFKWYFSRKRPQTRVRVGEMKENFLERERQHMVETMMKKQNVTEKQLNEFVEHLKSKRVNEADLKKIQFEADESYRNITNNLLAVEKKLKYAFDIESQEISDKERDKIYKQLITDFEAGGERQPEYIRNNPYTADEEYRDQLIELANKQVTEHLNDPYLLRGPDMSVIDDHTEWKKYRTRTTTAEDQSFEYYNFEDEEGGGEGDKF